MNVIKNSRQKSRVPQERHIYSYRIARQWIQNHSLKTDLNKCFCRPSYRTRFVGITNSRSVYITVNDNGGLEYQSYDFSNINKDLDIKEDEPTAFDEDTPSLSLQDGISKLHRSVGKESFTFKQGQYTCIVEVGLPGRHPSAYLTVKRNGSVIKRERCQSFAYAKKVQLIDSPLCQKRK